MYPIWNSTVFARGSLTLTLLTTGKLSIGAEHGPISCGFALKPNKKKKKKKKEKNSELRIKLTILKIKVHFKTRQMRHRVLFFLLIMKVWKTIRRSCSNLTGQVWNSPRWDSLSFGSGGNKVIKKANFVNYIQLGGLSSNWDVLRTYH